MEPLCQVYAFKRCHLFLSSFRWPMFIVKSLKRTWNYFVWNDWQMAREEDASPDGMWTSSQTNRIYPHHWNFLPPFMILSTNAPKLFPSNAESHFKHFPPFEVVYENYHSKNKIKLFKSSQLSFKRKVWFITFYYWKWIHFQFFFIVNESLWFYFPDLLTGNNTILFLLFTSS